MLRKEKKGVMTGMKPIIIFGTGRSGTTVFHRMLSEHPQLAWLSKLCDKYPDKPILNKMLMKSLEYAPLERVLRKKIHPGECYNFWDYYSQGFRAPCRDIIATDVSVKMKKNIIKAMSKLTTEKRNRLLLKITGWPRIGFLSEVFNDAKFIHIIRDGRAVANSLINVGFWRGWGGPEKWRWGRLSAIHEKEWNDYNQSFIVLAAIQWKILMDAANNAIKHIEESRIMEVKYEELCREPIPLLMEVAAFCEIEWSDYFEARLKKYKLRNMNIKYEQELNIHQQKELNDVLDGYLRRYSYL
jgi:omega-hydroxy-beta-dihydromenaquinone-9 sulfotransferase